MKTGEVADGKLAFSLRAVLMGKHDCFFSPFPPFLCTCRVCLCTRGFLQKTSAWASIWSDSFLFSRKTSALQGLERIGELRFANPSTCVVVLPEGSRRVKTHISMVQICNSMVRSSARSRQWTVILTRASAQEFNCEWLDLVCFQGLIQGNNVRFVFTSD